MRSDPIGKTSARSAVISSLAKAAQRFPDLPASTLESAGLSPADARLATAIQRTVLQRWITLAYLLDRVLSKPLNQMEPTLQAVLLSGAAQLVFMDRLPAHAVVNEQVELARRLIRPGAAGLVNAVLRKVAAMAVAVEPDTPWTPSRDALPLSAGLIRLSGALLPPTDMTAKHLSVATSHPASLIKRWIGAYGLEQATACCLHGIELPPTVVAVEDGFDTSVEHEHWRPHQTGGYVVWRGDHQGLVTFLKADPVRRVQDPASAMPVRSTAGLTLGSVMDYCAGRGTKTRQLAMLHPQAQVTATDVDDPRRASLVQAVADLPNTAVMPPDASPTSKYDLLLLDVPCSNTAVLARRPEARYRFGPKTLNSLVELQKQIARRTVKWVKPGGVVLYSTCSLESEENQACARWLAELVRGSIIHEHQELPCGRGTSYQDGGYHCLIRTAK